MSQPATEINNPASEEVVQTPPAIEDDGVGTPSLGHEESISNAAAVKEAIEGDELKTDIASSAEAELETAVKPAGEAVPVVLDQELVNVGVKAHDQVVNSERLSGTEISPAALGEIQGEFNPPKDTSGVGVFPDPFKTGDLANTEKNGEPLHALWKRRLSELLHIPPKILGGSIDKTPEQPKPLVPKTT